MASEYDESISDFDFECFVRDFFFEPREPNVKDIAIRIHNDDDPIPSNLISRIKKAIRSLKRKKLLVQANMLVASDGKN